MPDALTSDTRVAILATPEEIQVQLSKHLQEAGMTVVATHIPGEDFLDHLQQSTPNVLLIDLGENIESDIPMINELIDNNNLPILFNDSSHDHCIDDSLWIKKLVRKLALMAHHQPSTTFIFRDYSKTASESKLNAKPTGRGETHESKAVNIWILGASLGGPQAVRHFLTAIPADLPVTFLVAQHIGVNHLKLLSHQLQKVTPFKVSIAENGHLLQHRQIILIPADKTIDISSQGRLILGNADPKAVYAPNIDHIIECVIQHYGANTGVILFSGMGNDGVKGSRIVAKKGGLVWAQDSESCVVSNLPDLARKSEAVSFSGSPSVLASQLIKHFTQHTHA